MREAQADRDGGRRFQRDDHAEHAAGEHVDGEGQVRAANRLPVALVDHDQVDDRVVDLHLLQRRGHGRRLAAHTLQVTGGILAFPAADDLARVKAGDPQATVLRAGTRSFEPCTPAVTSRWNAARLRFCLVRNRFCSSSRMMRSTGSGKRPLPLPPPDWPGTRSVTRPLPCRARRIRTYTCRRDKPSA